MRWTWLVAWALVARTAHADYWTDQQNERLRQIEHLLEQYKKPDWFDGRTITAGTEVSYVENGLEICRIPVDKFEQDFPRVDKTIRAQPRAQAVQRRYDEVSAYCRAMSVAAGPYIKAAADAVARKQAADATEAAWQRKRDQFVRELGDDGRTFISDWAPTLDANKYPRTAQPTKDTPDRAAQKHLAALCAKYADLPEPRIPSTSIYQSPRDMCALAAMGEGLFVKKLRDDAQSLVDLNAQDLVKTAEKYLDGSELELREEYQMMLFERDRWLATVNPPFEKHLAKVGEKLPPDAWAKGWVHDAEVRAKIDAEGTTRAWQPPPHHDAAAEKFARAAFAKQIKGVKIRKIGSTYAKWSAYDEKTFVGSDAKYDYYRVHQGKNRYMRGWALLEIPGRPYCQAREWVVSRVYSGPLQLDGLSPYGTFMKCQ